MGCFLVTIEVLKYKMLTRCVLQMRKILLTATHASSPSVLRYDVGWLNRNRQPHTRRCGIHQ